MKLEQNYRSTQTILSAANGADLAQPGQLEKNLWTDARGGREGHRRRARRRARARRASSPARSRSWSPSEGLSRDEIAVFYRTNAQSRVLEDILVRYELPYQVIGGTKFYERAEIKDAVAYLQPAGQPGRRGQLLARRSTRRGAGSATPARAGCAPTRTPPGGRSGRSPREPEAVPGLGAAAIKSVSRFTELIEGLRGEFEDAPVAELLRALLERSGYLDALARRAHDRGRGADREPRGAGRRWPPSSTPTARWRATRS